MYLLFELLLKLFDCFQFWDGHGAVQRIFEVAEVLVDVGLLSHWYLLKLVILSHEFS